MSGKKRGRNVAERGELRNNNCVDSQSADERSNVNDTILISVGDLRKLVHDEVTKIVAALSRDIAHRFDDTDRQLSNLNDFNQVLNNKVQSLDSSVCELKQNLISLKNTSTSTNAPTQKVLESHLSSSDVHLAINNALQENQEKMNKKHNLIFAGIPEPSENDNESESDTAVINEIHRELGVTVNCVSRVSRLGKKGPKPRIVLVQYRDSDSDARATILRKAKQLRHLSNDSPLSSVFIIPDLTKKEREDSWKLREELKRRRRNGENVVIRHGAIVNTHQV